MAPLVEVSVSCSAREGRLTSRVFLLAAAVEVIWYPMILRGSGRVRNIGGVCRPATSVEGSRSSTGAHGLACTLYPRVERS